MQVFIVLIREQSSVHAVGTYSNLPSAMAHWEGEVGDFHRGLGQPNLVCSSDNRYDESFKVNNAVVKAYAFWTKQDTEIMVQENTLQ